MRLKKLTVLIPLLMLLMQLGYAFHNHSLNSYQDEQDCFHTPSIQCTLEHIDTLSADLPQPADFVPTILIHVTSPIETPFLTGRVNTSLLPSRAPPA
jgi:hypothetical protein